MKESRRTVSFGMCWQVYGSQTIDLPDNIDANDEDAVKDYIRSVWEDIPLPDGDYVSGSDILDEESEIVVNDLTKYFNE